MTRLEDIVSTATVFAGPIDAQQRSVLERLCAAADAAMLQRLREDLSPEECYDSFVCACAWLSLARLGSVQEAAGVESFTAGSISVQHSGGASNCLAMQAEVMMAPYLKDAGFHFQGV
ncbi:MAG: hypothetical protein E7464_03745 [Ruminococcaceae bacterium]|nr:hypothetical protein [Oscillospiraceae bacterium]